MVEAFADVAGGEDVRDGALCDHPAVADEDGVGGGGRDFLEVVGDEDAGEARVRDAQFVECGEELFSRSQIQAGGGLVEQEELRLGNERPRDQGPSAFALGQVGPQGIRVFLHAEGGDEFVGAGDLAGGR